MNRASVHCKDNFKQPNVSIIGVPKGRKEEESIWKKIRVRKIARFKSIYTYKLVDPRSSTSLKHKK